ncbi:hypothetical protein I3B33_10715 [Salmonella enterica]|uniref:Uncharacterized protein n=1 Tax=Salmonella enterica subsp. enterica serovar Abeokuta TaxID=2926665 RepID=A0A8T9IQS9_SALET|nr:hypothetical protein [Salmonella enterica]EAA3426975.1 hypothetical protein [Salmonella enterica subsp. enterica serovar Telelkebir]EAB8047243.1 hypothetical protein [Salmonella enterica subsp. enterica serovar Tees]EBH8772616.1 hypothetical protein [Salmonella enterica subsp. enterica serovar Lagos]EBR8049984.1 hypothetical protein [Salmonella enterica subsp. enterica serovar Altona]EBR8060639.1 hypothetical protein [Salmonella enterica subsp. enterica serovar Soerenga]EBU8870428.1 hypoth
MLELYFKAAHPNGSSLDKEKRLLAVQAALEVLKASYSGSPGNAHMIKDQIEPLADAIQAALNTER